MKALAWMFLMSPRTSRYSHGRGVLTRLAVTLSLVLAVAMIISWLSRG